MATEQQRLRRDISWNLVPVVLLGVVGLGLNFLIGAWWDAEALGHFNLVTIAFYTFAVVGAGGLQYAVLREVAEAPDDVDRVAGVVVGALVPVVALSAIVTAAFVGLRGPIGRWQSPAVAEGMLWAAPGLFCFAINKVLLGVVNGLRRMRAFAVYMSFRLVLIAGGLVLARAMRLDAEQLPVIWTIAEGTLLLVLVGELLATVRLARCAGWVAWSRRHLDFGARGVTATLALEINAKLDVWLLGAAVSGTDAGVYSLASALGEGGMQIAVALQNNLNPVMARELAAGNLGEVEALVARTRRWFVPAFAGACLLGALVYPLLVPRLLGDPAFAGGTWPFAIIMLGMALASPYLPFTYVLLMASRPGWYTVYVLAILAVNLTVAPLLIPVLGPVGGACGTASSLVASALLARWLARRQIDLRI